MLMYGYNTVIIITNDKSLSKTFVGAGIDLRTKKNTTIWNFGLIIPIRKPEVKNYMNELKQNKGVVFDGSLPPFG